MYYILYKTTNLINNKTYIGVHQTKKIDDGYLGSGVVLERAIKKYGKDNFKREILEFCLSYYELLEKEKIYVNEEWIKEDTNYNLKTGGQSSGFLSEESRKKISETLKDKYANGEIIPILGPRYFPNDEQKKQISETLKDKYANGEIKIKRNFGLVPWNKGKKSLKEPWNKGKKGLQEAWNKGTHKTDEEKKRQSDTLIEYYQNNVHPTKGLEPWNKGVKMSQTECPHCLKMVDIGNGKRWHFDNCKLKKN